MFIRDRLQHKQPVFSFEFFPPKTEKGEHNLLRSLERLAPLQPDFVSVTYGAGGSTRARTREIVARIKREFGIEAMAHLTCVGATAEELGVVVDELGEAGVDNILALRGDPPGNAAAFRPTVGGFSHADELVAFIRSRGEFCIGAACYPEVHPEAHTAAADMANLKRKVEAGADFLISQLFFDNAAFEGFSASARRAGITVPIVAGIMPVTDVSQVERFTKMCGATIPSRLRERLADADGDPQEVFWQGVSYAAHQCGQLLRRTTPSSSPPHESIPRSSAAGVHFYTLNKSPATRAIFEILQLGRAGVFG